MHANIKITTGLCTMTSTTEVLTVNSTARYRQISRGIDRNLCRNRGSRNLFVTCGVEINSATGGSDIYSATGGWRNIFAVYLVTWCLAGWGRSRRRLACWCSSRGPFMLAAGTPKRILGWQTPLQISAETTHSLTCKLYVYAHGPSMCSITGSRWERDSSRFPPGP